MSISLPETGVWRFDAFVLDTQRYEAQEFSRIDVRDEAQRVECPTLIMHSRDDHRVPMRFGEELPALIPDSRLVALSSNNHLLTATEPAWQVFRAEVDAFLA